MILSGQVEVSLKYKTGTIYLNEVKSGGYIGGFSVSGGDSLFTYESKSTTSSLVIDKSSLKNLLKTKPVEEANFFKAVAKHSVFEEKTLLQCISRVDARSQAKAQRLEQLAQKPVESSLEFELGNGPNNLSPIYEPETNQSKTINEPEPEHHIANQGLFKKISSTTAQVPRGNQIVPILNLGSLAKPNRVKSKHW